MTTDPEILSFRKRRGAYKKLTRDAASPKHADRGATHLLAEHFGCHIERAAAKPKRGVFSFREEGSGEAKINNFHIPLIPLLQARRLWSLPWVGGSEWPGRLSIEIFRLDTAVDDPCSVHASQCADHLLDHFSLCCGLGESLVFSLCLLGISLSREPP